MNPKYAQVVDWGSIPMPNSISYIIMHMETFTNVGGACVENNNGKLFNFNLLN